MGELSPQTSVGLAVLAGLGFVVLGLFVAFIVSLIVALAWVSRLSRREKKLLLKRRLRHAWRWLEERGLVDKNPALIHDYHRHYPALAVLERNFEVIRKECLELMAQQEKIPHIQQAGGPYTRGGIHEIDWKTFMLKSGRFLEANCRHAPETTRLLREVPDVAMAFFSILGPGQHIRAHWGYYKGFWRYHLGLVVPHDNRDQNCWLRVNDDRRAYDKRIRSVIEKTDKYYWHEGEGIVFDDTYLHDAANESDAPRAVLFLDLRRPLPWYLDVPNRIFIRLARLDPNLRAIHRDALMRE